MFGLVLCSFNENLNCDILCVCVSVCERYVQPTHHNIRAMVFYSRVNFRYICLGDCLLKNTVATKKGAIVCVYVKATLCMCYICEPN